MAWDGYKKLHNFPKDISPKVNVIAGVGFERIYFDVAVQYISHNASRAPSS